MRMRITPLIDGTNELDIKTLPDGRACIHWLKESADGPITIKGHPQLREMAGQLVDGRYVLVCNPKQQTINSQKQGNVRFMCMTSGELDAVTCPKCLATTGE